MSKEAPDKAVDKAEFSFDLINEPWIPVLERGTGKVREVSIKEAWLSANKWEDLSCASPTSTVSVIRLLLAIVYRACPPRTIDEWEGIWKAQSLPVAQVEKYLSKQKNFDLFSETRPFLQVPALVSSQLNISKLAPEMATDNNRILFEWGNTERLSQYTPAQAALRLLEIQCFGLGGGISGSVKVGENSTKKPNFEDGPVARSVSIWLSGINLFGTLWLNIVPDKTPLVADIPVWEQDDPLEILDERAFGTIDRLIWQSRLVRLMPTFGKDGSTVIRNMQFTQGRHADKEYAVSRDLMSIYREQEKKGVNFVRIDQGKASWRDLHSYLAFNNYENPILRNAGRLINREILPREHLYKLNVVGLVTNQASITLWRQDRMNLPDELLTKPERVGEVKTAIDYAEAIATNLINRLKAVAECFLRPGGKADRTAVDSLVKVLNPEEGYWARLEHCFSNLIFNLPYDSVAALDQWRKDVQRESSRARDEAYTRLGDTARAARAIAMGEQKLADQRAKALIDKDKKVLRRRQTSDSSSEGDVK